MAHPNENRPQPASLGEIITGAWGIFSSNFTTILIVLLIVYIPVGALQWALSSDRLLSDRQDTLTTQQNLIDSNQLDSVDWGGYFSALARIAGFDFSVGVLARLLQAPAVMAIILIAAAGRARRSLDFRGAFKPALGRWPSAFYTLLLSSIFLFGLLLALVVPYVIFTVYWAFLLQIVVLRDRDGVGALTASQRLVSGRWWRVFLYSLLFGLSALLVSGIINALNRFGGNFFADVAFGTITAIALSYFVVAYTVLFFDLEQTLPGAASVRSSEGIRAA